MRTTWSKVVFLGCLLASLPTYAQRPAIFYVADPAALNTSEQMVVDRLTVMGFTVTPIDDNLSDPTDANGQQLIVISSTVGSGNIGAKHTPTAVPQHRRPQIRTLPIGATRFSGRPSDGDHKKQGRFVVD